MNHLEKTADVLLLFYLASWVVIGGLEAFSFGEKTLLIAYINNLSIGIPLLVLLTISSFKKFRSKS